MQKPADFLKTLQSSFPGYTFRLRTRFSFHPPKTINLGSLDDPNFHLLSLHELAHAELGHFSFSTDAERLKMEVAAWQTTAKLCQKFDIPFDHSFAETELETYRNWLHQKSICKKCHLTRFQTPDGIYHCPHCDPLTS